MSPGPASHAGGSLSSGDLIAALARAGVADVDASLRERVLHSADASLYRVVPQVVVRPRHVDEIEAVLSVARATGVPLTARGAGTSIAGNAVGEGIVMDCSRHLNRIREVDAEAGTAFVEPGVVHADLTRRVAGLGLRFGPDPSTHSRCTVGGMIGNNACGSRALGYGRTSDNVEALDVVWGTGARELLLPGRPEGGVADELAGIVAGDLGHVRRTFGRFSRQVSGYSLEHLLPERSRPERFVVGSEGTLALVRGARLRLVADEPHRLLVVLGYGSMIEAAHAVPGLLGTPGMVACEGLDSRIVALVASPPRLPAGAGWLFVEVVGATAAETRERALAAARASGSDSVLHVDDPATAAALWRIREDGAGLAARSLGRPAHAGWEDAAVPPARLGEWLTTFEALLGEHGLQGIPYGHFGDGCVHVRIDFDFAHGTDSFAAFLRDSARELAALGGSLSGEHGDGRARSGLLAQMYDERSLGLFAAIKAAADPEGVLNPGILVDPVSPSADVRPARPTLSAPGRGLVADITDHAHRCTGVGKCVAPAAGGSASLMCPTWQATRREGDSTRGRARVLQEALDGDSVLDGLADAAVAEVLDGCLSCKGCLAECPTGVDMAALKAETLHRRHGGLRGWLARPMSHHTLGRLPQLLDSPLRRLLGPLSGHGRLARAARWVGGLDPSRSVPVPGPVSVREALAGREPGEPRDPVDVWIWADTFTDHFGLAAVEATLDLLGQAGLRARVVPDRACCGLTLVSTGQLDAAARHADATVARLAPLVADGAVLLGLEPSCLATLRTDVVHLAADRAAAERVAAASVTLAELLRRHDWTPPDLTGTRIVAQPHCHQAAVGGWDAEAALLASAGADVVRLSGCCGLAGNFGMERGHRELSEAVAGNQLLPALAADPEAFVLADGLSCRTQVGDLTSRRAHHLAELLAQHQGLSASG